MGTLKVKVGGSWIDIGGSSADEVWIGPEAPTSADTELWYDTDAPAVPSLPKYPWIPFTPVFRGAGTPCTIGAGGTQLGAFKVIDTVCFWRITWNFGGAGASAGSAGVMTWDPPVAMQGQPAYVEMGSGHCVQAGVRYNIQLLHNGSAKMEMYLPPNGQMTSNWPGQITNNDGYYISGFYEVAP